MGIEKFKIGAEREALQFACDSAAHSDEKVPIAWFDCGSYSDNVELAEAAGWTTRRNGLSAWFCPQCVRIIFGCCGDRGGCVSRKAIAQTFVALRLPIHRGVLRVRLAA